MGSFAATLFNFMLGWLQNLVSGLWDLAKSQQTRDMLTWLGEHWLMLVLLLAIGGLIMDYLIWFIRWRPYYVWFTWLRRLFGRGKEEQAPPAKYPAYEPVPAAPPLNREAEWQEEPDWQAETQPYIQPKPSAYEQQNYEQVAAYGEPVDYAAYRRPTQESVEYVYPQEETWQETDPMAESPNDPAAYEPVHPGLTPATLEEKMGWTAVPAPRQRRSRRNQRMTPQPLHWVRSGISQVASKMDFIGRDQDEMDEYVYMPPPPAVDKRQAFYAPVYPTNWNEAEPQGEEE